MRILFYSTNSNHFDGKNTNLETRPFLSEQWENLAKKNPEHKFIIATQLPGMFLLDVKENQIAQKAEHVEYFLIQDDDETKIAEFLCALNPDIAFAASFYAPPFDWLSVKDALIAEKLRQKGIKTICHPLNSVLTCFDKWETHQFFEKEKIRCAKAVLFNHELFINGGNRREIKSNVYKSAFFEQVKHLNFPLIIKDTTGLSSYGMDVVKNFEEAKTVILSKKSSSNRILEEMISGEQFGLEAIRILKNGKSHIKILPPFKFSVNKYGITSPKQSVKVGPVLDAEKYNLHALNKMIFKICEKMNFYGTANFDLVFNPSQKKWFVLEINPRLSGMTTSYAASLKKSIAELIFEFFFEDFGPDCTELFYSSKNCASGTSGCSEQNANSKTQVSNAKQSFNPTMNIKFPILSTEKIEKAKALSFVKFVNQQENLGAKQLREKGYSEIIFTAKTFQELNENLNTLKSEFKNEMEEIFFENAVKLLNSI